jgi:RAB protein geranylgeranyltransferase component A
MSLVQIELPQNQFNNVIRMVRRSEAERVLVLRNATFNALKALGVKRDTNMVVAGMPAGSNQVDIGSVITWVKKIKKTDTAAIAQLLQIDATCVACSS